MKRLAVIALALALLAGCRPVESPPIPSETPSQTPVQTPSTIPIPPAPALGNWTPTCNTPDTDAAALVANLAGALSSTGPKPGSAEFSNSADLAVGPLKSCPAAHVLAIRSKLAITPPEANAVVQERISAMLRSMKLTLGGSRVGRFTIHKTGIAEAQPVLVAVLGEPKKTDGWHCSLSGYSWKTLHWPGLTVAFRTTSKGSPIDYWYSDSKETRLPNLELENGLPFSATMAQLKKINPSTTQEDLFANGDAPYGASPVEGITYIWSNKPTGTSDSVYGGNVPGCE